MPDRSVDVDVLGQADRLAVVERLDLREFLGVRLQRVGERMHQPLAPGRWHRGPRAGRERLAGGRDGAVDVLGAALGDLGDLAARRGVDGGEGAPVGGLQALGADQQAVRLGDELARRRRPARRGGRQRR